MSRNARNWGDRLEDLAEVESFEALRLIIINLCEELESQTAYSTTP